MAGTATELLGDLDKDTVDYEWNYDETRKQPTVLPSRIPNLLINGSDGIAVGMACSLPPHNLREICQHLMMAFVTRRSTSTIWIRNANCADLYRINRVNLVVKSTIF